MVNDEDINKEANVEYAYAYSLLSSINSCDYAVIDIDRIPTSYKYIDSSKIIRTVTEHKSLKMLKLICDQILERYSNVERIDVIRSSQKFDKVSTGKIYENWTEVPVHIYVKFDDVYDLEPFYKDPFMSQIMCRGFLTFISYNGYMNIRISKKYNFVEDNSNIKTIHEFVPVVSYLRNKEIKYPEFDRWENKRSDTCVF